VLVTEDPSGGYLGWLPTETEFRRVTGEPIMIQHRKIFNIQFPDGYKAEEEVGHGHAIPLRIEKRA
jgi:hypothetical protein